MSFNPYSAGAKVYGGGRSAPNIGPVDPLGYKERDAKKRSMNKKIAMRKLKAKKTGNFFSADFMRGPSRG